MHAITNEKRRRLFSVRLTPTERALVRLGASRHRLTESEYIRRCVRECTPTDQEYWTGKEWAGVHAAG